MKENKRVVKKVKAVDTVDGAGVRLKRVFGFHEVNEFDPFLLLDHFESDNREDFEAGFPFHPHRGIETVTYLKKGEVEHQDKLGNKAVVKAGGIQWMTTGSGIFHQEMPISVDGINGFQLWVNMSSKRKMIKPDYFFLKDLPYFESQDYKVTVISGHYHGHVGPASDISPQGIHYFDIDFLRTSKWQYTMAENPDSFIYIYKGAANVGDILLDKGEGAILSHGDHIEIDGDEGCGALFISGTPIKEPVEWWGPIVMNTPQEIATAKEELGRGDFIK